MTFGKNYILMNILVIKSICLTIIVKKKRNEHGHMVNPCGAPVGDALPTVMIMLMRKERESGPCRTEREKPVPESKKYSP